MKTTPPTRLGTGSRRVGLTTALALCTALALPAGATTIAITNHSFEDTVLADGGSTATVTGWATTQASGATVGVFNPQDAAYAGSTGGLLPSPAAGNQAMFVDVGGNGGYNYRKQTTGAIIEEGMTYTMTVAVGARLNAEFDSDNIMLRLGYGTTDFLTTIAQNKFAGTGNLTAGEFKDFSVSFTAQSGEAYLGENLAVLIGNGNVSGNGSVTDFDNVRLTAVPEPSAALLLGGIGGLLLLRRRRR